MRGAEGQLSASCRHWRVSWLCPLYAESCRWSPIGGTRDMTPSCHRHAARESPVFIEPATSGPTSRDLNYVSEISLLGSPEIDRMRFL